MDVKGIGAPPGMTRLTKAGKVEDTKPFSEVLQLRISQVNSASSAAGPDCGAARLEQSEKVLDLLEGMAQALADPRRTVEDMEPYMRTIRGELTLLETGMEGEPDRGLSRLANEVSLVANVALFKFYRGDYA